MTHNAIGRYEILDELGEGGMGTVFLAHDPTLGREVAIKVLQPQLYRNDPEFSVRFEREARTIAGLDHSSIVPLHDFGEDGEWLYFVMRFMRGGTLRERIDKGSLDLDETISILGRIGSALDKAHSRDIIHRDLKPGNILFDEEGNAFLSDFGIIKLDDTSDLKTKTGHTLGTPQYMSPEQLDGKEIDGRSDIYSLGIILYEMLTGAKPFDHESVARIIVMQLTQPTPSIIEARPELPGDLEAVLQKATAKEPAERYSTASEMTNALKDIADQQKALAAAALVAAQVVATPEEKEEIVPTTESNLLEEDAVPETSIANPVEEEIPEGEPLKTPEKETAVVAPIFTNPPIKLPSQPLPTKEIKTQTVPQDPDSPPETGTPISKKSFSFDDIPKWAYALVGAIALIAILGIGIGSTSRNNANNFSISLTATTSALKAASDATSEAILLAGAKAPSPDGSENINATNTPLIEAEETGSLGTVTELDSSANIQPTDTPIIEAEENESVVATTEAAVIPDTPVTLYLNWSYEPETLDPSLASESTSIDVVSNLFMGLTRPDPVTGEVLPYLATDWEANDNATVYTFHIRDDIPWVNYDPASGEWSQVTDNEGNPRFVTADDVVYGVKRTLDPGTGADYAYVLYNIVNGANVNSGEEGMTVDDLGVEAINTTTVRFTLENPAAYFPSIAGNWVANPMPSWAIDEWDEKWTEAGLIVTNGPYGLEKWVHGSTINLIKNSLWPDADTVQIERIEGVIIPELSTAFAMYENNELDSSGVPLPELDRVKSDLARSDDLTNAPNSCTYYYGFNNQKAPFDDARVRTAFTQAIDRQGLIDNITKGGQTPATSFAPPGMFGAPTPGTIGLPYNPAAAQASLQTYLNAKGLTINDFNDLGITLMHNTSEGHANIAATIQQMWKDNLGVNVRVENQDWRVYLDTIDDNSPIEEAPHIFRLGWCADYPDENNWVYEVFNVEGYANRLRRNCTDPNCNNAYASEFDDITTLAAETTDQAKRKALYTQAEEILAVEEAAYAPLYHYTNPIMTKPWINRNYMPFGGETFYTWTIDQAAQLEARGE